MTNIAVAVVDGYLTHDPETKKTKNNKSVTNFTVAINSDWGSGDDGKSVSYIPVETWNKLAENCHSYLKKGRHVIVDGRLQQDRWEDQNGRPQSRVKIVAQNVRFGAKRGQSENETQAA